MECRILKKGKCIITQKYSTSHKAIDIVGNNHTLDSVIAHSDGTIIKVQDGYSNKKGSTGNISYGNYIKINHGTGIDTLYAHLEKGLNYKKGDKLLKGTVIGKMSDSGNAYGKHLHFEVLKNDKQIDPTEYLNKDLEKDELNYNIKDKVTINGVYISSTSDKKLTPLITEGIITKILPNVKNPYLLNNGEIGWINDKCIVKENNKYLSNKKYNGSSIVDALKEIKIDSSYVNREKIAQKNNIKDYKGTREQNIQLLNLLKKGLLKY